MKKLLVCCTAFLSLWIQPFFAQKAVVERIIEIGHQDNQATHQLDILTNRFGGRPIGSDAYENAAEWMIHEYKKWGLDAQLEEAGELSVGFNRGPWFGKLLSHDHGMTLHFATPSYTSGTKGVQRGHVLMEPRTDQEFERIKLKLKGAWVLISGTNNGWPIDRTAQADSIRQAIKQENKEIDQKNAELRKRNWEKGENNKMIPYKEFPALYYHEMVEAGALGFIQSSEVPIRALYDRKMIDSMTFDNLPEVPDIKLDRHQFDIIAQMVKERREDFLLEFDIRNHFKLGPIKYHNVVASIRGSKYPDEQVIVCGHLDAFDTGTGGIDCGTGIARYMDGQPLVHPTQGGNLFQEFVHLLIRRNRETGTFRIFWVPVLVFLQNDKSRFQKRYIASTAFLMSGYLHAGLVYPQFPLIILIKMCRAQGLHINIRQAGQTTEQEKILHGVQTCRGKVLLHNPFQFFQGQKRRARLFLTEQTLAFSGQRVQFQPSVFPGQSEKFAKTAHILGQGILGKFTYRSQMHLKPVDEFPTKFMKCNILFLVEILNDCLQRFITVVIT